MSDHEAGARYTLIPPPSPSPLPRPSDSYVVCRSVHLARPGWVLMIILPGGINPTYYYRRVAPWERGDTPPRRPADRSFCNANYATHHFLINRDSHPTPHSNSSNDGAWGPGGATIPLRLRVHPDRRPSTMNAADNFRHLYDTTNALQGQEEAAVAHMVATPLALHVANLNPFYGFQGDLALLGNPSAIFSRCTAMLADGAWPPLPQGASFLAPGSRSSDFSSPSFDNLIKTVTNATGMVCIGAILHSRLMERMHELPRLSGFPLPGVPGGLSPPQLNSCFAHLLFDVVPPCPTAEDYLVGATRLQNMPVVLGAFGETLQINYHVEEQPGCIMVAGIAYVTSFRYAPIRLFRAPPGGGQPPALSGVSTAIRLFQVSPLFKRLEAGAPASVVSQATLLKLYVIEKDLVPADYVLLKLLGRGLVARHPGPAAAAAAAPPPPFAAAPGGRGIGGGRGGGSGRRGGCGGGGRGGRFDGPLPDGGPARAPAGHPDLDDYVAFPGTTHTFGARFKFRPSQSTSTALVELILRAAARFQPAVLPHPAPPAPPGSPPPSERDGAGGTSSTPGPFPALHVLPTLSCLSVIPLFAALLSLFSRSFPSSPFPSEICHSRPLQPSAPARPPPWRRGRMGSLRPSASALVALRPPPSASPPRPPAPPPPSSLWHMVLPPCLFPSWCTHLRTSWPSSFPGHAFVASGSPILPSPGAFFSRNDCTSSQYMSLHSPFALGEPPPLVQHLIARTLQLPQLICSFLVFVALLFPLVFPTPPCLPPVTPPPPPHIFTNRPSQRLPTPATFTTLALRLLVAFILVAPSLGSPVHGTPASPISSLPTVALAVAATTLTIATMNVCGVQSKCSALRDWLSKHLPSIAAFTETQLSHRRKMDAATWSPDVFPEYTTYFGSHPNDSRVKGQGVALCIHNNLIVRSLSGHRSNDPLPSALRGRFIAAKIALPLSASPQPPPPPCSADPPPSHRQPPSPPQRRHLAHVGSCRIWCQRCDRQGGYRFL